MVTMSNDRARLAFTPVCTDEADALAEWLAGESWPFHSRTQWTPAAALESIRAGDFSGLRLADLPALATGCACWAP